MNNSRNGTPMRVAYVTKRYPRYSETFIVNEILAHEKTGLQIEIFSLRSPSDTHFQDTISQVAAPVHYLPSQGIKAESLWSAIRGATTTLSGGRWSELDVAAGAEMTDVYQGLLLAAQLRQRDISHIHAHFASAASTVARIAARFAGITYSLTAHAKDIFHEEVDRVLLSKKLHDASAVVTVSDFNVRFLTREFGVPFEKMFRIYNGMDLERLAFSAPGERTRKSGRVPQIVSVGRLVEKKGFADLIRACELLKRRGGPFRCLIIGHGELEAELRQLVSDLELQDCVSLAGPRPQNEVLQILRESDVFAAPCVVGDDGDRDGLPTVLLEAMSLGTPCISTDVTGIPEVLRHDHTGMMVPQNDPESLANALERLIADPDLQDRYAGNARRLMEAEFDIHRNTSRLRNLFLDSGEQLSSWSAGLLQLVN